MNGTVTNITNDIDMKMDTVYKQEAINDYRGDNVTK